MKQLPPTIGLLLLILKLTSFIHFSAVSSKGLGGIHLKFTAFSNPPYVQLMVKPDGNYTTTGIATNIFDWLSKKLNFTYSVTDPVIDPILIAKYGYNDLAIDKLDRNEVDSIMAALIVTPDRAQRADFTSMMWSEPYTIVAPKPEQKSRLFAFIRPFHPTVWLYLAVSVIVIAAITSGFSFIFKRQLKKTIAINDQVDDESSYRISKMEEYINTFSFYAIYAVNILSNHGIYSPFSQHSFRILATCWLLAALVLVNSYSGIVVSSLTVPTMKPAVNTFEDFASNEDVSILLSTDVVLGKTILNATTGIFKILGDQARENPKNQILSNAQSIMKQLEAGHYGYPFVESFNRNFVALQYKRDGHCRFQMSPPLQLSTGYFCYLVRKKFPHTSSLSLGLSHLWETGLTRYWVVNIIPKAEECFDKNKKLKITSIQKVSPIKLEDLVSAFLILGIGVGLGILTFFIELIIKCL